MTDIERDVSCFPDINIEAKVFDIPNNTAIEYPKVKVENFVLIDVL